MRPRRVSNRNNNQAKIGQKIITDDDNNLDPDWKLDESIVSKKRKRPPRIGNGTKQCLKKDYITCDTLLDFNSPKENLDTVVGDETEEKDPLNKAQSFDLSSVKNYEIKESIISKKRKRPRRIGNGTQQCLKKHYITFDTLLDLDFNSPKPFISKERGRPPSIKNGTQPCAEVQNINCDSVPDLNSTQEYLDTVVGDETEEKDPLNSAQSFDLSSVKKYEIKEEKEEIIDDISLNDSFESEASQTHSNLVLAKNYETLNILEPMPTFSAALPTNGIFEEATVHDVCSNNENGQLISVCEDEDTISISSVECCGNGTNYEVFVGDFNSSGGKESPITIRDDCTSHRIINDENFRSTKTMELSSNTDQDNEETKKEIYDSSTTLENLDIMYYSNILKVMKVMFTNKINSFEPRVLEDPIFEAMYTENLHNPVSDHTKIEILKKLAYGITLFEKIKNKDPTILSIRNCFNPAKLYVLLDTVKEICENFEQVEIYGSPVEALSWFLHAAGAKITNNVISGSDHERIKEIFVRDVNIVLEVINSNWGGLSILKSSKPDKSTPGVVVGLSSVFINSAKPSDENDSLSCLENDFIQSNETIIHSIDKLDDNLLRETLLKKPIPTMGTNTDQSSSNNSVSNTNKKSHFNEKNKRNYFRDKLEKESSPQVNILPLKYKMTKSYCLICRRFVPNFIKHILVKHKDREPITQYMALLKENPKGSIMKRKNILRLFQKKNSRAYIRTDPKNMPLDNTPRKSLGETSLKLSKTSQIFSGVLEARENLHIYENSKFIKSGTNSKISLNHHKCNKPVENLAKSESNQTKNNFRKKCESLRTVKQSPSKDTGTKNIEQDSIRIIGNELPAFKQSNNLTNENSLDLTENNYRGQNSVAMGQVGEKPTADICGKSSTIGTENSIKYNNSLTNTTKKSHVPKNYGKKHYCYYCDKSVMRFPRHVIHKHRNEEEVKKINELSLLKNNKEAKSERKELLTELRLKSNHVKIEKLLAERSSQKLSHVIQSWRNYKWGPKPLKDIVMCSFCKGIYSKKNFSSHIKRCYSKKKYERGLVAINQVGEKPTSNICGKSSTEKNYLEKSKHLDREELQTFVSNNQEKKLIDQDNVLQSKNQTRKNYFSFFKKLVHRKVKMSYSKKISYPNNQNNNHNFSKTLKYACKQTQLTKLSLIRAKNYCLFCKKLVSKFTKHVFIKHKDKEPIMEYMDLMQENTEESLKKGRKIIRLLHLTSNNAYITKNVQSIPSEKTSEEHEKINILLSSKTPQSTEVREDAQKHDSVQLIKYGISSNDDFLLKDISHNTTQGSVTKKYGTFFAMSNVACLTPQASSKFIELLLSRTQKDHISISALNDPLLVSTASSILERFSKDTGFKRAIPFIRDGGALLICAKKIDNTITEFRDLLKPSKLNTVFEATKEICGLDEKTGNIKFTSKPFRVTYVINQASAQVLEEASTNTSLSENCRMQIKKDIDEFLDLKRAKFRSIITHWPASKKQRKTSAIIESDKSSTNKRGRGSIKKRKIYSSSESEESSSEELEGECKELHKRENKRRINSEEKHQVVSNSSAKDGSSFFTKKKWSEPQKRIVIVEFKDFIMNGTNPGRKRCRQLIASCDELAGRTPDQVNLIIDNINKGKLKLPPEFQYLKSNHL